MNKPNDYYKYFNNDGTEKKVPYDFFTEQWGPWLNRQTAIAYSLMNDEEKAYYDALIKDIGSKMQSSVGGMVFHS